MIRGRFDGEAATRGPEVRLVQSRTRAVSCLAQALVAGLALAAVTAPARADEPQPPWLTIDAPADDGAAVSLPLVEVRGRAAPGGAAAHDLVIVLDASDSTILPSGWDVDGDGPGGRTDPARAERFSASPVLAARMREADLDDSVLMAELAAARALLDRIDLRRDRVALVVFSDDAEIVAPLGRPRPVLDAALDEIADHPERWLRGTDFGAAIAKAQSALGDTVENRSRIENADDSSGRHRSILFLSDGEPTLPAGREMPRQHALWSAHAAATAGIRIHAFALGEATLPGLDVFRELAALSGGRFERLAEAGDAIARLPQTDLVGLAELRIVNETTGHPARAVRTFPDGRFDGFVELVPGTNVLRVDAVASDGTAASATRRIVRAGTAPDLVRTEALLGELRRRTQEVELRAEMERTRRVRSLELELRVEPRSDGPERRPTGLGPRPAHPGPTQRLP